MNFCWTGQYTPQSLNGMMENPSTNPYEAAKKLVEAAGGKLIDASSSVIIALMEVESPRAT